MVTRRNDPLRNVSTRTTPQSQRADPRQVPNSAGGFTFQVDGLTQLRRFLTLGTAGGTYYVSERDLTHENAHVVIDAVREYGTQAVNEIVSISSSGRAPRNQPALFALAIAISSGNLDTRRLAATSLPHVARTGTHLAQFVTYVRQFRGWGRVLDRAIEGWYLHQEVSKLAYQVVKYRQREGWTHRDVLRLAHPKTAVDDHARRALFDWICHSHQWAAADRAALVDGGDTPKIIEGFEIAQRTLVPAEWARCVTEYGLPWEALPTEALNQRVVWEALLAKGVPQTALMRQLSRLTNLGLLPTRGGWTNEVVHQLTNAELLKRARVHPINVLVAQRTYASGHGVRGSQTWTPTRRVVDALDQAFYAAYEAVEPTGKRVRLALDVSGSMDASVAGLPLTCREASAAIALVTANVESDYEIVGFTGGNRPSIWSTRHGTGYGAGLSELSISPRQRLDDVIHSISRLPFGGTDCALPMIDALEKNIKVDTFVIYTDNETWYGDVHPHQALERYRQRMGIPARLVVVSMTANQFTIADPTDAGMLDVEGFNSAVPSVISDFARGTV